METGVEAIEDASLSKEEVACAMPDNVISRLEEEKSKERRKQDNMEVHKDNGAKALKSSWRAMFHEKENVSISSSQLNSKHCDAANISQYESIKVTEGASCSKDNVENAMPVMDDLMFAPEEINNGEGDMEDEERFEHNEIDEVTSSEGKEENGDETNEQDMVSDEIVVYSKEDAARAEKQVREKVVQSGFHSANPTLEVKAGLLSQKKKVLKKAERTGMIFMCNKWTKQDCFDYKVFGLPASMRNVVLKVSKGTRLFLFDTDLRVMYGIYRAVGRGDYNIEPNAFNSAFPSQVRFTVVEECTPLPEEKFRMAIKDNYYRKNMFSYQLTSEQVKKLSKLFVAASGGSVLSLKIDDLAKKSKGVESLFSSWDLDVGGNVGNVKQETLISEEVDEENVTVRNKEKAGIVEDKTNELLCLKADNDDEVSTSEGGTGMIFLCNSKTKQDCFRYKVLGLPESMREIVQKVYKGMRLFMFDVDLRVMYGIYKAADPGGYNIEATAFSSAFPSQVRFSVVKDCAALTEEKFKAAIIDNYYWKNKFNLQLTSDQVNKLSKLFVAASNCPDSSMKVDDVASTHQIKANEIALGTENNGKTGMEEKNEPMSLQDGDDGESSGEEENKETEYAGVNSEETGRKKRKRGRASKLLQRAETTGMIFMCNSKTKQDCLRYKVLGLPANMREIVQKVDKGTRLFMFDVDLRVMYGIYKAAGPGGYNIEPKAFNSDFPSQVRFTILEDCLPLREEVFKAAIKDNYYTRRRFKGQLTSEQVKNLCKLFSTANKGRDRVSQQNLNRRITYGGDSYIQRVVVPLAQFPPLAHIPSYVPRGEASGYRRGSLFYPQRQRRVHSRQLRNRDVAVRSRQRRMIFQKDIELKNRYLEEECRRLGMLLQCCAAEYESLRLSLQNTNAFDADQA